MHQQELLFSTLSNLMSHKHSQRENRLFLSLFKLAQMSVMQMTQISIFGNSTVFLTVPKYQDLFNADTCQSGHKILPKISVYWSKSHKHNLSKADTCLKRINIFVPKVSALDRFYCILSQHQHLIRLEEIQGVLVCSKTILDFTKLTYTMTCLLKSNLV